MKPYSELTRQELLELKSELKAQYTQYQNRKLTLNMARRQAQPGAAESFHGHDGCAQQ